MLGLILSGLWADMLLTLKWFNTYKKGLKVRVMIVESDAKLDLAAALSCKGLQIVIRL